MSSTWFNLSCLLSVSHHFQVHPIRRELSRQKLDWLTSITINTTEPLRGALIKSAINLIGSVAMAELYFRCGPAENRSALIGDRLGKLSGGALEALWRRAPEPEECGARASARCCWKVMEPGPGLEHMFMSRASWRQPAGKLRTSCRGPTSCNVLERPAGTPLNALERPGSP